MRELELSFESDEFKLKSSKLKILRDKYYAHLDKKSISDIHEVEFYYADLDFIISHVSSVLSEVYELILDTHIRIGPFDKNGVKRLVEDLADYSLIKSKENVDKFINGK